MLYLSDKPSPFPPDVARKLMAVDGYIYLGMALEALEELDGLSVKQQREPAIMRARIRVLLHLKSWKQAEQLSTVGCNLYPEEDEFMVQRAFALHQQEKGSEAVQVILDAPEWLRSTGILHYNLACYEAKLGDLGTAKQCIRTAIKLNASFKTNAKKDPDLQRLWN